MLRTDYVEDCQRGVTRWNKVIAKHGIDFELKLPSRRFNRSIGAFGPVHTDPDGNLLSDAEWQRRRGEWLPNEDDEIYIKSLMQPVYTPGQIAQWIAPPRRGINSKPFDFEYVRRTG